MNWSQFNYLFKSQTLGYCLHNTRTLSLIKLDEDTYNKLLRIKNEPNNASNWLADEEYQDLINRKILVSDYEDKDYVNLLAYNSRERTFKNPNMSIIICPTLGCNFACPYCYEKDLPQILMSEEVQDNIIKFIKKYEPIRKGLSLNWHGGEPLIAFKVIKQFYSKLEEISLPIVNSSMVSNGYLLNEEVCSFLEEHNLKYLQITIDGLQMTHDKTRKLKNGKSSFKRIVENVDMASELMPNCTIGIRTNISRTNKDEYIDLYHELESRWKGKNVVIYNTFVVDNVLCKDKRTISPYELSTDEKCEFHLKLAENGIMDAKELYPNIDKTMCTCSDSNAYVVDPNGYLYKCWADVGKKERSIGDVVNGVTNRGIVSDFILGSDKFSDDRCRSCKFIPICNGGCSINRIGNKLYGSPYNNCAYNDESLKKYIEAYVSEK